MIFGDQVLVLHDIHPKGTHEKFSEKSKFLVAPSFQRNRVLWLLGHTKMMSHYNIVTEGIFGIYKTHNYTQSIEKVIPSR